MNTIQKNTKTRILARQLGNVSQAYGIFKFYRFKELYENGDEISKKVCKQSFGRHRKICIATEFPAYKK